MTILPSCARVTVLSLLWAGMAGQSVAAQGLGLSAGLGGFRSHFTDPSRQSPGVGEELIVRWAAPSGLVLGLGARLIHFERAMRGAAFLDARYAPAPSVERKVRPIIGGRLGPFVEDPGVSLTLAGDLTVEVSSNDYANVRRRLFPGLMVGLVFH